MAALMLVPGLFFPQETRILFLSMNAMALALFACALNLLLGQVGLLSLGHAMFLAAGAYVTGSAAAAGLSPELAILLGVGSAAVLAVVAGALVIRKPPIYSAIITAALAEIVYLFCVRSPLTGGDVGLIVPSTGLMFGILDLRNKVTMYYVVMAIFLLGFLVIYTQYAIHPLGPLEGNTRRPMADRRADSTSWRRSCCRERSPGLPARSKRSPSVM